MILYLPDIEVQGAEADDDQYLDYVKQNSLRLEHTFHALTQLREMFRSLNS
jgi:hypothetical protein